MPTRRLKATVALLVWTGLIWTTRIANISRGGEPASRLVLPVLFTAFGLAAAVALWGRSDGRVVNAFAGFTVAVWFVRIIQIKSGDHSQGFVAVHAVLALVSILLAALTARELRRADLSPASRPG
jgi:uncharacterized membrane protein